jgi:ABC-type transport system substrate-binding protein
VQSWHVEGNLFSSLLTIDSDLNYVPDLAESWEILEGGTIYVFHLTFRTPSDGDPRIFPGAF